MADKKPNQTEGEFFAVATVGRRGVEEALAKMGGEIMSVAAAPIAKMGQAWIQRQMVYIVNNENLKDVIATRQGLFSVVKALAKAAGMGITFGGQFPQAHLVPFYSKAHQAKLAEIVVTKDGYKHAAKHGPVPVIRDIQTGVAYANDSLSIDQTGGTVRHSFDPMGDRGKVAGVWGIIEQLDGAKIARWMSYDEAIAIRDKHSRQWIDSKSGPWKDDEIGMVEKTAAKKFLKPYAAEAEGLAQMWADDEYVPDVPVETPPPRDVTERVSARLDMAAAKIKPVEPEPVAESEVAQEPVHAEAAPDAETGPDLF